MSEKHLNKYRIPSARLQRWDYGWNAPYFITICTKGMEWFFGNVIAEQMHLSPIGEIAKQEWIKTAELRPDMNLELGAFTVMPNHFHAIIIIGSNSYNNEFGNEDEKNLLDNDQTSVNQFMPQSKNLASIIRGFKASVTKQACLINPDFAWQPRFHDHIIREERIFQIISQYIEDNPLNWMRDKYR